MRPENDSMSRRAAALAFVLAASVGAGACFDWTVGTKSSDGGADEGGGDAISDGGVDGAEDGSGDAVADADASDAPVLTFECPSEPGDAGRVTCVRPTQECCRGQADDRYTCEVVDSGCAPRFACTRSKECPAARPYCCYGPLGGPSTGSASCEETCGLAILCTGAAECTALEAGSTCKVSSLTNPPPDPLLVCGF
jgi:hypothetical protein